MFSYGGLTGEESAFKLIQGVGGIHFSGGVADCQLEASLVARLVKNPPAMQETLVGFLGQEDPLEKR